MIQTRLGHIQFNIKPENRPFYQDLLPFLGYPVIDDSPEILGVGPDIFHSFWFFTGANDAHNDYDGPGLNHIGLLAQHQADVDTLVAYLRERNISLLFDTPRHRPEFAYDAEHTYYQVMFETPDRILIEVVYMGRLGQ